nr:sorbosone dehydrogenase family protein [Rhizobium anhuiense]
MMKLSFFRLSATSVIVAGLASSAAAQSDQKSILGAKTSDWTVEVVTDGLDYPWDLARSGKTIMLTEAAGNLVSIAGSAVIRYPVITSDPIAREGGGGLLGMALPDDFATTGVVYFYHTYRAASGLANKVIEARFDGSTVRETRVLLAGVPGHRLYNGGRIALGPDGNLYVTTGWTENPDLPQDRNSLAGKILRMTRDGQPPSDNPFRGSLVYSYGHRNPQGLAWNARGELFVAEHGQSARDEINRIQAGGNYGWPVVSGSQGREGMIAPYISSGNDTWAPSGVAFSGNELLVSALQSRALLVMDEASGALTEVFSSNERLRDIVVDRDAIYVITTNRSPRAEGPSRDRLLRLTRRS